MIDNEVLKPDFIQNKIYTIRGLQVMLDRDLAEFYLVKPVRLREQAKRNIKRFPSDFMFQLTEQEVESMVSQNAIPSKQYLGGSLPYAFTEQGVAAVSAVLTSDRAIEVNIQIMRAFVAMRRFLLVNGQLFHRLDSIEKKQIEFKSESDEKFKRVFDAIEQKEIIPQKGIFFDGQVFDAYKFVSDLIRSAKKSIVIIDNYIDDSVLNVLAKRNKNVAVTIFTNKIFPQLALDVKKYNAQYPPIEIKEFKNAHDRFLILDNKDVYHIGASLKDLGKKWFAFSKFEKKAFQLMGRLTS
ncbi:MAG: ORF6N domain-containing protein [Candidatus Omnitrophica bacterium]|nr:ORF6N domain-containing protein [Candidatus Omnitrophota bacterium]